jgi:hypothetical protein
MSTKTLKKRIALVAVSTLTAGFLSVVSAPVANAAEATSIARADIVIADPAANTSPLSVGQCAIDASARLAAAIDVNSNPIVSTGTVLAVGAVVSFDTATNGTGNLTVTGPAVLEFTANINATSTISTDAKSIGFSILAADIIRLKVTGVGDIVVTASTGATIGAGTAVKTFGITGVTSCANSDTVNVANSSLTVQSALNQNKGTTGDDTLTGAEKSYTVEQIIAVVLQSAYKSDLVTNVLLTAEATNGALVGIDATPVASTAFLATTAGVNGQVDVRVKQNTVAAPGAAVTTTVTVKANGVTIGSKTLTLLGAPFKIVVDQGDVTTGVSAGTGAFKYTVVDNAGNGLLTNVGLMPAFGSITAAAAGWEAAVGSVVTSATATTPDITSTSTKGTGTFACVTAGTGTSGSADIYIGAAFTAGVGSVKSNTFKATCGNNAIRSWTASMDKVTYSPGEIATLTISAKDANGGIVADTTTVGANFANISVPGMTVIGTAIATGDLFTAGVRTYKFRVDQAEGSFVGQAHVTTDNVTSAEKLVKTLQFSIKSSSGAVTNADVLKSIVALIASINKQIQALQKLILARR